MSLRDNIGEVAAENERRRARLNEHYDPLTGEGSKIERFEFLWQEGILHQFPTEMLREELISEVAEATSLRRWWYDRHRTGTRAWPDVVREVIDLRLRYDVEFWASRAVKILMDAETRMASGDTMGSFILNRAQRIYLAVLIREFFSGRPVRILLLKARQWGGSTLTQVFFAWVQLFHRSGWNAFVCALNIAQASHIRAMFSRLAANYPPDLGSMTLSNYQGVTNIKYVYETESIIGVSSIERPNNPRSFSIQMAHLSEVGLWPSTPSINAETYAQSIVGAVAEEPYTIIVEESTAKGVGTYFHRHWTSATAPEPETSYVPVFVAWHEIPKYQVELDVSPAELVGSFDDYETDLWQDHGCTLEQILWYRRRQRSFKGDRMKMQSEFPTTAREAFQSTGAPFFAPSLIDRMRSHARPASEVGYLVADAAEGEAALQNIRFKADAGADLHVWQRPGETRHVWRLKPGHDYSHRYVGFADFGGKSEKADWSVLTILDRFPMLFGGGPELAARVRLHLRPDLCAWYFVRVCQWYEEALFIPEVNRHRHDRGDDVRGLEPEWSYAVFEEIADAYYNIYLRGDPERLDDRETLKIGFLTTDVTKPMFMASLDKAVEEEIYVELDERCLIEMENFERRPDGRLKAVAGQHDDMVISTAGAVWAATSYMSPVDEIRQARRRRQTVVSAASL